MRKCLPLLLLLVVVSLLIFIGCRKKAEIVQEVKRASYFTATYNINTYLWVKYWDGRPVLIESSEYAYGIDAKDIGEVKKQQYEKIHPLYLKLQEVLKAEK